PRVQVSPAEQREAVERFLAILNSGDIQGLLEVLAPDVVLVADGGGQRAAARHPIEGADRVVEFLSNFARVAPRADVRIVWLNGAPAVWIDLDGELDTAVSLVIENGRISRIYAVRNPEKLGRLGEEMRLSRTH
ncbi:MAG TPA: nuclear transport factor 2 family protein, partial [Acidimicrobiia bacterium]|nr:nuclear transport factor 2 family protein [Acidimicrobiia bacterium]